MHKYIIIVICALFTLISCDSRNSISRSRPESTYSCDITAVKDYSQRKAIVNIRFWRDGTAYEKALIKVDNIALPSIGSGSYFAQTPAIALANGSNQIAFADTEKAYSQTITFDLPDSFGVSYIYPRPINDAVDVRIDWSNSNRANKYILSIVSRGYPANGTTPLAQIFDSGDTTFLIPNYTFVNQSDITVYDTYLIYLVAYKDGFGEFPGMHFPLPEGLPQRRVTEPSGYIRYGIVAPVDSIVVQP